MVELPQSCRFVEQKQKGRGGESRAGTFEHCDVDQSGGCDDDDDDGRDTDDGDVDGNPVYPYTEGCMGCTTKRFPKGEAWGTFRGPREILRSEGTYN